MFNNTFRPCRGEEVRGLVVSRPARATANAQGFRQPDLVEVGTRLELPRNNLITQSLVSTLTLAHRCLIPDFSCVIDIPDIGVHLWIQAVHLIVYTTKDGRPVAAIDTSNGDDALGSSVARPATN